MYKRQLVEDESFREKFNEKIQGVSADSSYLFPESQNDFKSDEYTVVFVIVSRKEEDLKLPFLSRLAFIFTYERLSRHYKVKYKTVLAVKKEIP